MVASLHYPCILPQQRKLTTPTKLSPAGLLLRPHPPQPQQHHRRRPSSRPDLRCHRRLLTARGDYDYESPPDDDDDEEEDEKLSQAMGGFDTAVALFNGGDFHACHDVVEELWYTSEEPTRTLLHGLLQCAVGFYHLFNQNHRGAMMELGEGLCKLRKLHLDDDDDDDTTIPFYRFQEEVAAALNFIYRTQKELAACTDDLCLTMDGSVSSYQLLGNFAKGQQLYRLQLQPDGDVVPSIVFSAASDSRVKLPTLSATEQHLSALQCTREYF
ncbi:uncharacterized protein LOC102710259 [Oryza brachyantha]|uniref:DUF309 domain-containing protein n=1 Tax=Oryza brachyantha TaxID=4533 RepID=J3NB15_ORYBR|nr:uncharacterized protein LOC102710259 [Oryza brachyantha]XP_015698574.1 uncharacterized protein LOC102710259 [Oryza brachyantha]